MIACDTECRAVGRKWVDAEVSDCALLIFVSTLRCILLRRLFSTLEGMMFSATTRAYTLYVLMGFIYYVSNHFLKHRRFV